MTHPTLINEMKSQHAAGLRALAEPRRERGAKRERIPFERRFWMWQRRLAMLG